MTPGASIKPFHYLLQSWQWRETLFWGLVAPIHGKVFTKCGSYKEYKTGRLERASYSWQWVRRNLWLLQHGSMGFQEFLFQVCQTSEYFGLCLLTAEATYMFMSKLVWGSNGAGKSIIVWKVFTQLAALLFSTNGTYYVAPIPLGQTLVQVVAYQPPPGYVVVPMEEVSWHIETHRKEDIIMSLFLSASNLWGPNWTSLLWEGSCFLRFSSSPVSKIHQANVLILAIFHHASTIPPIISTNKDLRTDF